MKDEETLEELIRFKEALARPENASDSSSSVNIYLGNRGCKLKRKARYAYRGKLGVPSSILTDRKTVYYGLKGRTVIQRKRPRNGSIDTDAETSTHSDDPYHDIDIDELLAPISHPAEFLRRSYRKSLQFCLESLTKQLLDAISEERAYNILLSKLLFLLLGDDTSINMTSYLKYQETKETTGSWTDQTTDKVLPVTGDVSQSVPCQLPTFMDFPSTTMNDTLLWCHQMGLSQNDINDLRKLLQSALDRSMEYIRCLMQVRNGITRAQRLTKKVYEWCVEASKKES